MACRVIFLDRDGTLNVDHGYIFRKADWQFTDHAIDALRMFRDAGFRLALVTNQSGIARGYYGEPDVQSLHEQVQQELIAAGAPLDSIAYCPHGPDSNCDCRKPRTGMARQIEQRLGEAIDYRQSWTIGDKLADMEFGWSLQTRVALIHSPYWDPRRLERIPDLCVTSLYEAARRITGAT